MLPACDCEYLHLDLVSFVLTFTKGFGTPKSTRHTLLAKFAEHPPAWHVLVSISLPLAVVSGWLRLPDTGMQCINPTN